MTIPTTPEFCTVSDVKELLGAQSDNATFDLRITKVIQNVTKGIQKYCRRNFIKQARTEFFSTPYRAYGVDPYVFYPKEMQFDLTAPFLLYYDEYIVDWTTTDALTLDEEYAIDTNNHRVLLFINTIRRSRSLKLTYTAGFPVSTSTETPNLIEVGGDLRNACAMQSYYSLERMLNKQIGQRKIVSKDKEIDLTVGAQEAFLPEILPTLNAYRSYASSVF